MKASYPDEDHDMRWSHVDTSNTRGASIHGFTEGENVSRETVMQTGQVICHAYDHIDKEIKAGHMIGSATVRTAKFTAVGRAYNFSIGT